jgi:hypothetical protein
VLLGNRKQAFDWLLRACDEHASIMLELDSPIFDKIRDAPEFKELTRRVNMPMIPNKS